MSQIRKEYDLTIILVSHDLDLVRKHADRVVLLNRTVILNGKPEEVYTDKRMHETFGLTGILGNETDENGGGK
nr:hypothetical protein [Ruminiclostridium josui]